MRRVYHVYILTNRHHNVLYTGITGDIIKRIWQHKQKKVEGFTKRYNVTKLVYFEGYRQVKEAIAREKQIKRWARKKKERLINQLNPKWNDLYEEVIR